MLITVLSHFGYSYPDIFEQGVWVEMQAVQDPELRELADSLPEVVLRGKAPSTVKQYSGAFVR